MTRGITSRAQIAQHAATAAMHSVQTGEAVANPYPIGSDQHAEFARRLHVALLRFSSEALTSEASA